MDRKRGRRVAVVLALGALIAAAASWMALPGRFLEWYYRDDLFAAIRARDPAAVRSLLAQGASVDLPDARGRTPVFVASELLADDVVLALVEAGGNVDSVDAADTPALVAGCRRLHRSAAIQRSSLRSRAKKTVTRLLRSGANPNACDAQGVTALMLAASIGYASIVSDLLEADADVDFRDERGRTALHWAVEAGWPHVVQVLLIHHADRTAADDEGRTALDRIGAIGDVDKRQRVRDLLESWSPPKRRLPPGRGAR